MRRATPLVATLLVCGCGGAARAEAVPFEATLRILTSVETSFQGFPLLSVQGSGVADVEGGVVRIAAGQLQAVVPSGSGFGGALVNGAATFSPAGAGPGSTCPLLAEQEVCIQGGGFGGRMGLLGVTQAGQVLSVWGLGGTHVGYTSSGSPRVEQGRRWTAGNASAWFFVTELDPGTPFLLSGSGSFRGLPSTFTGAGPPGFSLVAPMVVTADLPGSQKNVRGLASLRIDFDTRSVPAAGAAMLASLLLVLGASCLGLPAIGRRLRRGQLAAPVGSRQAVVEDGRHEAETRE